MGLDASVLCDCFEKGRTAEPPVPREWFEVDEDGYLVVKTEFHPRVDWPSFYEWEETCCPHPRLRMVHEGIANWGGYRLFQQALGRVGWDRFPVLKAELPNANGGLTSADRSLFALAELSTFRGSGWIGSNLCLVDSSTGETVCEHVASDGGVFAMSEVDHGFDADGFFIRDHNGGPDLFRSMRFRQTLLDPDNDPYGSEPWRVVFHDPETGRTFEGRMGVSGHDIPWPDGRMQDDRGRVRSSFPAALHVEARPEHASDYDYAVDPLTRVFRASVETGNPVRWS